MLHNGEEVKDWRRRVDCSSFRSYWLLTESELVLLPRRRIRSLKFLLKGWCGVGSSSSQSCRFLYDLCSKRLHLAYSPFLIAASGFARRIHGVSTIRLYTHRDLFVFLNPENSSSVGPGCSTISFQASTSWLLVILGVSMTFDGRWLRFGISMAISVHQECPVNLHNSTETPDI
ncbi:hypothetical protein VNO77_20186 [Canavalia gladiata]|uniref:Uncharacterized protein n=1 Tax=Canavalia gladiata TaxID=3824 RepID=A0AAN9QL33_CANGL